MFCFYCQRSQGQTVPLPWCIYHSSPSFCVLNAIWDLRINPLLCKAVTQHQPRFRQGFLSSTQTCKALYGTVKGYPEQSLVGGKKTHTDVHPRKQPAITVTVLEEIATWAQGVPGMERAHAGTPRATMPGHRDQGQTTEIRDSRLPRASYCSSFIRALLLWIIFWSCVFVCVCSCIDMYVHVCRCGWGGQRLNSSVIP